MKNVVFLVGLLTMLLSVHAQKGQKPQKKELKHVPTEEQKIEMIKSIPLKDNQILYDVIITTDSSIKREQIFLKIRQWFVDNFSDSKSVLEVNDIENGLLTGKGIYKYANISGITVNEGYTRFTINVAVKDGKFRYQLYDFTADNKNSSILTAASSTGASTYYTVKMDEMVALYNSGKREKYARKFLEDMVALVYYINQSLVDLSKQKGSITDF